MFRRNPQSYKDRVKKKMALIVQRYQEAPHTEIVAKEIPLNLMPDGYEFGLYYHFVGHHHDTTYHIYCYRNDVGQPIVEIQGASLNLVFNTDAERELILTDPTPSQVFRAVLEMKRRITV